MWQCTQPDYGCPAELLRVVGDGIFSSQLLFVSVIDNDLPACRNVMLIDEAAI